MITKLLNWDYYESFAEGYYESATLNDYEIATLGLLRNCHSVIRKDYISISQVNGSGMQYSVMFIIHPKLPFFNYAPKSGHQQSESVL